MTDTVSFTIFGNPRAWKRARPGKPFGRSGKLNVYEEKSYTAWKRELTFAARQAMRGELLIESCVLTTVDVFLMIPKSWSKIKKLDAARGDLRPGKRPDIDNFVKAVLDSCNGNVWIDDALVVDLRARKYYGDPPRIEVEIRRI